jgi:hypothetical protein
MGGEKGIILPLQYRSVTMATECTHLGFIRDVDPSGDGCKECLEIGEDWGWCYVDELMLAPDAFGRLQPDPDA